MQDRRSGRCSTGNETAYLYGIIPGHSQIRQPRYDEAILPPPPRRQKHWYLGCAGRIQKVVTGGEQRHRTLRQLTTAPEYAR